MINEKADFLQILLVDDDTTFCETLKIALSDLYTITPVFNGRSAMAELHGSGGEFELILLDMKLPEIAGLELLRIFKQRFLETPVIMLTGNSDSRSIVDSMKAGASDYVVKGSEDFEGELRIRIGQALDRSRLLGRNRRLEATTSSYQRFFYRYRSSPPTS